MKSKIFLIIALLSMISGCGETEYRDYRTEADPTPTPKPNCSVIKTDTGATISCPDGSTATVTNGQSIKGDTGSAGSQGVDGQNGQNGTNGQSCEVINTPVGATIMCEDSSASVTNGTNGQSCEVEQVSDGAEIVCANGEVTVLNGENGAQGQQGVSGTSCSVAQVSNGAMITCGSSQAVVLNGVDGKNGVDSVTSLIAPCGLASSPWKEELMCLNDGVVLASFSDNASGLNTRFSIIPTGSYIDTDNSGCNFSVNVAANGTSTVSWGAGSNSYSTWQADSKTCTNNQ